MADVIDESKCPNYTRDFKDWYTLRDAYINRPSRRGLSCDRGVQKPETRGAHPKSLQAFSVLLLRSPLIHARHMRSCE